MFEIGSGMPTEGRRRGTELKAEEREAAKLFAVFGMSMLGAASRGTLSAHRWLAPIVTHCLHGRYSEHFVLENLHWMQATDVLLLFTVVRSFRMLFAEIPKGEFGPAILGWNMWSFLSKRSILKDKIVVVPVVGPTLVQDGG